MYKPKHTEAPWKINSMLDVDNTSYDESFEIINQTGEWGICRGESRVNYSDEDSGQSKAQANAELIAAAPELLALGHKLLEWLQAPNDDKDTESAREINDELIRVLEKADSTWKNSEEYRPTTVDLAMFL